ALNETRTKATKSGGGWTLSGKKIVVWDAASADRLIVLARSAGDPESAASPSFAPDRRAVVLVPLAAAFAGSLPAAAQVAPAWRHALSLTGEIKYGPDFRIIASQVL
ncbi:MAG: hypothetical protein F6K32_15950, partial [Desertifilum sp. SIO1I2]|nr:hypothetical protein [Desertifilum sp. SIO1I2]